MIVRYLVLLLAAFPFLAWGQLTVPENGGPAGWVHDQAGVLSAGAIAELEQILKAERDSTSNQIAVLIVPSLQGEIPEEFVLRVAQKEWKLGQAKKSNGALLFISIQDRIVRIEAGYGMEGTLTDAMSSRINRNEIAPRLRQNDFDGGVKAGVIAIMQTIRGEYKNDEPPRKKSRRKSSPLFTLLIIIAVIIFIARRRGGGGGGGGYWSSGGGFMGPMGGGGFGSSSGSWDSGDFGGGGGFGGGGSTDSW